MVSGPAGLAAAIFRAHGMRDPIPRIQMLDGFNEGWIKFERGGTALVKGQGESRGSHPEARGLTLKPTSRADSLTSYLLDGFWAERVGRTRTAWTPTDRSRRSGLWHPAALC